jgi:hypothetical protein
MAPPGCRLIFNGAANSCAPVKVQIDQSRRRAMKKFITIVALAVAVVASPALAAYDPGPTTGSASNQAEHALGRYQQQSGAVTNPAATKTAQMKQAEQGDFYAAVPTIAQQPTAGELKQAQEGDFYTLTSN